MASFSPPLSSTLPTSLNRVHLSRRNWLCLLQKRNQSLFLVKSTENGAGNVSSTVAEEKREPSPLATAEKKEVGDKKTESLGLNGAASSLVKSEVPSFKDERWVGGTWDLKRFQKGGKTDWDAVIDAGKCNSSKLPFNSIQNKFSIEFSGLSRCSINCLSQGLSLKRKWWMTVKSTN
jgi:hypothetical protein